MPLSLLWLLTRRYNKALWICLWVSKRFELCHILFSWNTAAFLSCPWKEKGLLSVWLQAFVNVSAVIAKWYTIAQFWAIGLTVKVNVSAVLWREYSGTSPDTDTGSFIGCWVSDCGSMPWCSFTLFFRVLHKLHCITLYYTHIFLFIPCFSSLFDTWSIENAVLVSFLYQNNRPYILILFKILCFVVFW